MKLSPVIFILCIMAVVDQPAGAQTPETLLMEADQLYENKKYTEAYQLYRQIFSQHQKSSPEMLAKMAYINEGLGNYSMALYYLNLYYMETSQKAALRKMESLAKEHGLTGYEYTDLDFFENLFQRYFSEIVYFFLALALLLFGIIYLKKQKKGKIPMSLGAANIATLVVLLLMINLGRQNHTGVIVKSNAHLMTGPSAGANLIDVVDQGHKVRIVKQEDVWYKIKWQDQTAYIRKNNILRLF